MQISEGTSFQKADADSEKNDPIGKIQDLSQRGWNVFEVQSIMITFRSSSARCLPDSLKHKEQKEIKHHQGFKIVS